MSQAIGYTHGTQWPALRIDAAALVVEYDEAVDMPTPFTAKQGQYLAFIYYYSKIHGMHWLKQTSVGSFGSRRPSYIR